MKCSQGKVAIAGNDDGTAIRARPRRVCYGVDAAVSFQAVLSAGRWQQSAKAHWRCGASSLDIELPGGCAAVTAHYEN